MPFPVTRGAVLLAAWAAGLIAFVFALQRPALLFVNLGAGDAPFANGFRRTWERDGLTGAGETMFHWTEDGSRLELPLDVRSGRLVARLRLARFANAPAEVAIEANGVEADRWVQRPLGWRIREVDLGEPRGPLRLAFRSRAEDGDPLGLAIDWVEVSGAGQVWPSGAVLARLLVFLLGVPLAAWAVAGASAGLALGILVSWLAALFVTADRLGGLFGVAQAALPAVLAVLAVGCAGRLLARAWPDHVARGATIVPLVAVILALAAVSHPFYFYPDVDTHQRLFQALRANPLLLVDPTQPWARRGDWTRTIGGNPVPIPYAVVFHGLAWPLLPLLGDAGALKTVAASSIALTLLLVFALARALGLSPSFATVAQVLAASLPVMTSRLVLALYPTLLGQALLTLVVVHLVRRFAHLDGARDAAAATLFLWMAQIVYTGSILMVAILVAAVLVVESARGETRRSWRLLGAWAVATALVMACYVGFLPVFWRDVLPHLGTPSPTAAAAAPARGALASALTRLGLFYDGLYPLLLVPGVLALRAAPVHARRIVAAALAAGGAVLLLRYVLVTVLRDAKDVELLAAPVAATAAAGLAWLWDRRFAGRALAVLAGAGAVGWGLVRSTAWYADRFVAIGR